MTLVSRRSGLKCSDRSGASSSRSTECFCGITKETERSTSVGCRAGSTAGGMEVGVRASVRASRLVIAGGC